MKEMIYKEETLNIIKSFISSLRPETTGLITDIYDAVLHQQEAQPDHTMRCNFCDMSICTLKDRPCSRKVMIDD